MTDLQGLLQEKENDNKEGDGIDTVSLLTTGQSNGSKVEYNKLVGGEKKPTEEEEQQSPSSVVETEDIQQPKLNGGDSSNDTTDKLPTASPQQGQEEKKQDSGQYSGFAADYDAYDYDPYQIHYHNTPQTLLGGQKPSSGGFLCCLFPWLRLAGDPNSRIKDTEEFSQPDDKASVPEKTKTTDGEGSTLRRSSASDIDDELSTGEASTTSENLGERLSEKDRQAVLARLRLAQPDASLNSPGRSSSGETGDAAAEAAGGSPSSKEKPLGKGLLRDIPDFPPTDSQSDISTASGPKGILKRSSMILKTPEPQKDSKNGARRSLFPMYETSKPKAKNPNHVKFSPMARVVTIKSQKEMTAEEKSRIWWQRWDYEDFRKTGRIITRAMLEGGSEIWLASNQSWQHQGASKTATLKNAMTLAEKGSKNSETADIIRSTGDKWWHKFGHSRRGLEHIASIKEGGERQANVRHAIKATLDEQRRQKTYLREDPEKLRMVSIHNTSWARDLALAAGHSDADAVMSEFNTERKSREFYLLKMARTNSVTSQGKHVPAFMKPAMTTFSPKLDAHTSAQIMDRRKQHRHQLSLTSTPLASKKKDKTTSGGGKSMEPIHDPSNEELDSMARRAAGFSHDGEQVNMAAVLSGMGAVPKIAQPV